MHTRAEQRIKGQKDRIRTALTLIKAACDAVAVGLEDGMGVDVEAAQNVAYMAVRLVSDVARLYQVLRGDK